ncbi:hypothetical protein [Pseudoduganella sp. RAF53_2]|jgi:hypothetical protein|uniref:hypothetical protein n=1 Tax=unclassified Pseudoduganella TaxID=2637179 RepID=UPI003F9BB13A
MKIKITFVLLLALAEMRWGDAFDWVLNMYPIADIRAALTTNVSAGDRNGLNVR